VAIGRGTRHRLVGDRGAAAGTVLDDDRRSLVLGDVLAQEPRQDVGATAGREGHHDADGAPGLRPGLPASQRNRDRCGEGGGTDQAKKLMWLHTAVFRANDRPGQSGPVAVRQYTSKRYGRLACFRNVSSSASLRGVITATFRVR